MGIKWSYRIARKGGQKKNKDGDIEDLEPLYTLAISVEAASETTIKDIAKKLAPLIAKAGNQDTLEDFMTD